MGRYKEIANRSFEYFTKADVFQVFERPDRPNTPDITVVPHQRQRALCQLRVLSGDNHTVVIATEIAINPGASITNASCELATKAVTDFSLNPRRTRFIEHYTPDSYVGKNPNDPETYDELTFNWQETTASNPHWRRLQPQEIAELRDVE